MTRLGRLRRVRCCGNQQQKGRASALTVVFICGLFIAPAVVGAQSNDALITEATAPLDEDLKDGATVYVEYPEGNRRVLQWGTNGWICGLSRVPSPFAQCYEGEARQLFMSVVDQRGQPVLDVRTDEVSLEQSGALCTIMGLHPDRVPMTVALLIDNSDAAGGSLTSLRDGLRGFLETLPPQHEVGLFTIANQTRQRVEFTTDREALIRQVDNLFIERLTGTLLVDGLVETWHRRFDEEDAWPVFVMVLYDSPEISKSVQDREFNEFVSELRARAATAHAILVSTWGGGWQTNVSINMTDNTGGIYRALAAATALPVALTELATAMSEQYDEVKDRYRVVFECDDDPRRVRVRVNRPAVAVRVFPDRRTEP